MGEVSAALSGLSAEVGLLPDEARVAEVAAEAVSALAPLSALGAYAEKASLPWRMRQVGPDGALEDGAVNMVGGAGSWAA